MKKVLPVLLLWLGIQAISAQNPGCDGSRYLNDVFSGVVKTTVNFAPTVNQLGQNINLAMDVYEPQGDNIAIRPVVVLAHGGSFIFGDKSNLEQYCVLLAKKGYVAATIDYRLYPFLVLGFPDSIDIFDTAIKAMGDMKAAVRFFREDAAGANQFHADVAHIYIGGYSAGAVTALHTSYLDENDQVPAFLQGIVTNNGGLEGSSGTASNHSFSSKSSAVLNMSGGLYRSFWVDGDESPLVSIHGTADETVPYTYGLAANIAFLEGSSLVHARANAVGLYNNLLTVPGAGHTDLYDQAQWKPYVDQYWVNATTLLESLTCTTTGVNVPVTAEWAIFPNPASKDGITIRLPEEESAAEVRILDAMGKTVVFAGANGNLVQIATGVLPAGIYAVAVKGKAGVYGAKKLVIE